MNLSEIREAVADYIASEGCSCCRSIDKHDAARDRLGKLLRIKKYKDGSGYDFYAHQRKEKNART